MKTRSQTFCKSNFNLKYKFYYTGRDYKNKQSLTMNIYHYFITTVKLEQISTFKSNKNLQEISNLTIHKGYISKPPVDT